jgi:AsmA family protein
MKTFARLALLLAVSVVAVVIFYDWNALRPVIEARLSETLRREVQIEGPLEVRLGLRPHIVANDLRVANAP